MKVWFVLLALVFTGYAIYWIIAAARRAKISAPGPAASELPTNDNTTPLIEDGTLPTRLHDLASRIEPFAHEAAHPSEISTQKDFIAARDLLADVATPFETVVNYALGASFALSYPALAALAIRPDRQAARERVLAHFEHFPPWGKHFALLYLDGLDDRAPVGAPVLQADEYWNGNNWITAALRDSFERRAQAGDHATFGAGFAMPPPERITAIRNFLNSISHPFATALLAELDQAQQTHVDKTFLNSFGRIWNIETLTAFAVAPEDWLNGLEQAGELVKRKPARSLVVVGEASTGKTTFLRLLGEAIEKDGWQIFEAGGAELMAGQQWFGQLEERIRRVVSEVTVGKKLIWYVPDLLQLARSGTHQGQSASILEQIAPAMANGSIAVWTEATPAMLARLLQMQPGLRNLLEMVRLEPMDIETVEPIALEVAARMGAAQGVDIDPRCAIAAIETAQHYLSHANLPGSALSLLKLTIRNAGKNADKAVAPADVIATLAQLTGLPVSILDGSEKLDLAAIRAFFAARVMGQDEAVEAVVERIAMLKAGLNDPGKPIGVFLFAGPTGTGKTELAKTTAEFLFGSPDRMIRIDMSECQTPDTLAKILGDGTPGETGSLIARVRKQPFSVVLLDEFEKSWSGIWDLFLQVFDDGRLSDPSGHVADFRHCLIILTSNLGATAHRSGGFGFAPPGDTFSNDQVLRAIAQTYRPEFQNRIDRVIVFRPLDRELMRGILRKELEDILARRGLKDREWAVEWESSALEFLLEKGFTPEMGARPLKRAVDRYLLAPLAATIVERKYPEGEQFLFVRSDGKALQIEFVNPDGDTKTDPATATNITHPVGSPRTLAQIMLASDGSEDEFAELSRQLHEIESRLSSADIDQIIAGAARRMSEDGFWDSAERFGVLARYALIDRIKVAAETARHLHGRLEASGKKQGRRPLEVVARLAAQIRLVRFGIADALEDVPVEAAISIEPALDSSTADRAGAQNWCADILAMYRTWATKRNMQIEELPAPAGRTQPLLLVTGFGAWRMLVRTDGEAGLHVLESEDGASRFVARVQIVAAPLGDLPDARRRALLAKAFDDLPKSTAIVRRYRREPPLVRNGAGTWRSTDVAGVLAGNFDILSPD